MPDDTDEAVDDEEHEEHEEDEDDFAYVASGFFVRAARRLRPLMRRPFFRWVAGLLGLAAAASSPSCV